MIASTKPPNIIWDVAVTTTAVVNLIFHHQNHDHHPPHVLLPLLGPHNTTMIHHDGRADNSGADEHAVDDGGDNDGGAGDTLYTGRTDGSAAADDSAITRLTTEPRTMAAWTMAAWTTVSRSTAAPTKT